MNLNGNAEPRLRHVARDHKKSTSSVKEICEPLPLAALNGKGPEEIEELESVNKILRSIMNMKNIQTFHEKPNDDLFGMSTYYKIIKNPIWLYEVKRKFNAGEYKGLADFIQDMRLLFENCYRFWGPQNRITKKGLKMEEKFELKLQELPKHILDKLNREMPEGSIGLIDSQVPNETLDDDIHNFKDDTNDIDETSDFDDKEDSSNSREPDVSKSIVFNKPYRNASVFESKILKKVIENDVEEDEENEEQVNKMKTWEREFLVDKNTSQEIRCMWELGEIGSFLKLTCKILNVEEITMYEVERMLLMPKESTTLMTLMTSILSPEIKRPYLDESPLMPYEIWTGKIKRKIDDWLRLYYKLNNQTLLLEQLGVDPFFWNIIKDVNPLNEKRFHELTFYERAVILKALCNNIFHTNKTLIELFTKEEAPPETLRPTFLGKDSDGNKYISLPVLPEIRVYKESKFITKTLGNWNCVDLFIQNVQEYFTHYFHDEENVGFGPTEKFRLMADDLDSLSALIGQLKIDKQFDFVSKLHSLETEARAYKIKYDGLRALYQQWHTYRDRAPEYFSNMLNLWSRTGKPALTSVVEEVSDSKDFEEESDQSVLGKRKRVKLCYTSFASDDESESDDEYIGEPSNKKKNKKIVEKKKENNKLKTNGINNNVITTEIDIKQKQITLNKTKRAKPPTNNIKAYKPFQTQSTVNTTPNNRPNFPLIKVIPKGEIKQEVISSDEDVNVSSTYAAKHITSAVTIFPVKINHAKVPICDKSVIIQKISNPKARTNQALTIQPVRQHPVTINHVKVPICDKSVIIQKISNPKARTNQALTIQPVRQHPVTINHAKVPICDKSVIIQKISQPQSIRSPLQQRLQLPQRQMNSEASFSSPPRSRQVPAPISSPPDTIPGTLSVRTDSDGTLRYRVILSDGGCINLSVIEVEELSRKNNGVLPLHVNVPVVKRTY